MLFILLLGMQTVYRFFPSMDIYENSVYPLLIGPGLGTITLDFEHGRGSQFRKGETESIVKHLPFLRL